jgi:hypothetical protein
LIETVVHHEGLAATVPRCNVQRPAIGGVRSESAYGTLVAAAFPFVWVMEGGVERWIAAGCPTVAE